MDPPIVIDDDEPTRPATSTAWSLVTAERRPLWTDLPGGHALQTRQQAEQLATQTDNRTTNEIEDALFGEALGAMEVDFEDPRALGNGPPLPQAPGLPPSQDATPPLPQAAGLHPSQDAAPPRPQASPFYGGAAPGGPDGHRPRQSDPRRQGCQGCRLRHVHMLELPELECALQAEALSGLRCAL